MTDNDEQEAAGPADDSRLRELAEALGCLTEADFQLLAQATKNTVDAWRRRGTGPAYARIGNRIFYPREAVAELIRSRVRAPSAIDGKGLL